MKQRDQNRAVRTLIEPVRWVCSKKAARFDPERIASILVLKADHLGDLMTAAPAVRSLANHFPQARITLAGSNTGADLYRALGLIHDAIGLAGPSIRVPSWRGLFRIASVIRRQKFDLVVNFRHDIHDIIFAFMCKGRFLCTYDHKGLGALATHPGQAPLEDVYEAENHLRLVRNLGVEPVPLDVPPDSAAEKRVAMLLGQGRWTVLHPVARTPAKQWPMSAFAELAKRLVDRGMQVVCVGDVEDRGPCEAVLGGLAGSLNLAGRLSFSELFALLRKANNFVGVDSFVMHAAHAIDLPAVAIFSGTNLSKRWAPPSVRVIANPVPCAPCHLERCNVDGHPCLVSLPVDRVIEALDAQPDQGGER